MEAGVGMDGGEIEGGSAHFGQRLADILEQALIGFRLPLSPA